MSKHISSLARLDDETNALLRELAEREDRTLTAILRRAIRLYAEQREDK